jgi:hypothetical protein
VRRAALAVSIVALGTALFALPASAITFGHLDGTLHPNVGALIANWEDDEVNPGPDLLCTGTLIDDDVFLTAAHCTAYLESLGIDPDDVWVTFDPSYDDESTGTSGLLPGTYTTDPRFTNFSGKGGNYDPHDLAVVVLDDPVGITPAELPTEDLLGETDLLDETFTAVGYGTVRETKTKGPNALFFDGTRRWASQSFMGLRDAWLQLSMQPSLGDGGTCFGDSGGPHFLGDEESNLIVSITSGGDAACRATDQTYRIDTASARAFLDDFVTLP